MSMLESQGCNEIYLCILTKSLRFHKQKPYWAALRQTHEIIKKENMQAVKMLHTSIKEGAPKGQGTPAPYIHFFQPRCVGYPSKSLGMILFWCTL